MDQKRRRNRSRSRGKESRRRRRYSSSPSSASKSRSRSRSTSPKYSRDSRRESHRRPNTSRDDHRFNRPKSKRHSYTDQRRRDRKKYSSTSKHSRDYESDKSTRHATTDFRGRSNTGYRRPSQKPQGTMKIGTGPLFFKGTPGLKLKRTPMPINREKDLFKPTFKKPQNKNDKENQPTQQEDQSINKDYLAYEWEEMDREADRIWYTQDEGHLYEDFEDTYFVGNQNKYQAIEEAVDHLKEKKSAGMNAKQRHKNNETNKWELNRMITSGVFKLQKMKDELDEHEEKKVVLQIHDIKPPFLDGRIEFTKQTEPIQVVKDRTSDMAILAKKGSRILRQVRHANNRQKMREKFWELAGTRLGNVLKIEKERMAEEQDNAIFDEKGEVDFRKSNNYSVALAKKQEAVSQFAKHKTLKEQREYLPIFSCKDELLQMLYDNRVVIVVGETGSGKTTQLTQFLHEDGYSKYGKIGCTQPRRVAAVSVAKRVAVEMDCKLGTDVGYAIRFEDCTSKDTKIKYMTDGVLLRESLTDPDLDEYSCIVMDEAHERSLNTDVLFGILQGVAQRRRDIKIIITSATMNAKKFSKYYSGAPIYEIPGRCFPVDIKFSKAPCEDYVDAACKQALTVHLQQPPGDILIFMTGQEDIEATCVLISERIDKIGQGVPPMIILPIYSQLASDVQAKIFEKSDYRKCIVATNIAETSLTLDGVKYVIDSGFCKMKVYNPKLGVDSLQVTPISQANANQRSGRAGRTGPGKCFRLYTILQFRSEMLGENVPEIQRTNLSNIILLLKSLGIENLIDFPFMDPPPQETIQKSIFQLWVLGALDNTGELTKIGRKMAEFPIDPPLSKMLLTANRLGCSDEMATIVSMLSVPSIYYRPKNREEESDSAREKLFVPESDHLTLLNVFRQWKRHEYSPEWCTKHFIHLKSLRRVREIRAQLLDIMKKLKLEIKKAGNNLDLVRQAVCSGYFINAARIKAIGEYNNLRTGIPCKLHPSSALFSLGYAPDYVVYHELLVTTKEYMSCVTTVDPYWLADMGPMFFSIKESFSFNQSKKRQMKLSTQQMEEEMRVALKKKQDKKEKSIEAQLEKDRLKLMNSIVQPGKSIRVKFRKPRIYY